MAIDSRSLDSLKELLDTILGDKKALTGASLLTQWTTIVAKSAEISNDQCIVCSVSSIGGRRLLLPLHCVQQQFSQVEKPRALGQRWTSYTKRSLASL